MIRLKSTPVSPYFTKERERQEKWAGFRLTQE
jgi:hypothetical protein